MKYLLVIAIENYADPKLGKVAYTLNDANALVDVLETHGFSKAGQYVMLEEDATKTLIESRVRKLLRILTEDDELVVYYAGHGFCVAGQNVITARDSQYSDLGATTIPLADLFAQFRKSDCRRITVLLDACHAGVTIDPSMRSVHTELDDDELQEFFHRAEYCTCFASCRVDESSYSSPALKHGIWTHHLLEALLGDAPLAFERGNRVTSNSLQNYLVKEVPRTIRRTFTDDRTQTPWMCGGATGEFVVADLTSIIEARRAAAAPASAALGRVTFVGTRGLEVRRLSGFKKSHTVPKEVNSFTESFVERIGSSEVESELDDVYRRLRDGLGLKRREIDKDYPGGSSGTVMTPAFDYSVSLKQDPDEPSDALLEHAITNIRQPDVIMSDEFQGICDDVFDTVEFHSPRSIDVEQLIDSIEDAKPGGINLDDYDDDCTYCDLSVDGMDCTVRVTSHTIEVTGRGRQNPRDLAELFTSTWTALLPAAPKGMLELPAPKDDK